MIESLATWITEHTGLAVTDANRDALLLVARQVAREKRLSLERYLSLILVHGQGGQELVDRFANHESFFLRGRETLEYVAGRVVPNLLKQDNSSQIRMLSAACAQGEEPYSLAILLNEFGISQERITIEGFDIAASAIRDGQRGLYSRHALRQTEESLIDRHFIRMENEGFLLDRNLRDKVRLRRLDLLVEAEKELAPPYHVIFCRNLLIHLTDDACRRAMAVLDRLTATNGWLFVDPAEGYLAQTLLGCGQPGNSGWRLVQDENIHGFCKGGNQPRVVTIVASTPPAPLVELPQGCSSRVQQARLLADTGAEMAALEMAESALRLDGTTGHLLSSQERVELHLLMGLILRRKNAMGDVAATHFREVLRLVPDHRVALLFLQEG